MRDEAAEAEAAQQRAAAAHAQREAEGAEAEQQQAGRLGRFQAESSKLQQLIAVSWLTRLRCCVLLQYFGARTPLGPDEHIS